MMMLSEAFRLNGAGRAQYEHCHPHERRDRDEAVFQMRQMSKARQLEFTPSSPVESGMSIRKWRREEFERFRLPGEPRQTCRLHELKQLERPL